jgi:hypothetical protein
MKVAREFLQGVIRDQSKNYLICDSLSVTSQVQVALWKGRYTVRLVQGDSYLLTCYRYIEAQPARANLTDSPADYR